MIRTTFAIVATFACVSGAAAADKSDLIVGTWKLTASEKLPDGAVTTWVFNKEGTASSTLTLKGGQAQVFAHRWRIEGDQLIITTKTGTAEATATGTIVKLDKSKMQVKDTKGADEVFTRLK
jgi:uncharacterized protein (TIGR03066 family)